jgi:putative transcriptional regulator
MKTTSVARLVVGGFIATAALAASAQGLDKALLLVASPETKGFYSGAVMVVVPKDKGHVGFIINRPTRTTLAAAFPEEPDSAKVAEPIYLGGPRAAQSLYAVVRKNPGEGARNLFGEVFVTVSGATVDRIIRESPHEARYFAGYAGWEPGDLEEQITEGDWLLTAPDEGLLFDPNPAGMWAGLVQRIGKTF